MYVLNRPPSTAERSIHERLSASLGYSIFRRQHYANLRNNKSNTNENEEKQNEQKNKKRNKMKNNTKCNEEDTRKQNEGKAQNASKPIKLLAAIIH